MGLHGYGIRPAPRILAGLGRQARFHKPTLHFSRRIAEVPSPEPVHHDPDRSAGHHACPPARHLPEQNPPVEGW